MKDIFKYHNKESVIKLLEDSILTLKRDKRKLLVRYSVLVDKNNNGHTVFEWYEAK